MLKMVDIEWSSYNSKHFFLLEDINPTWHKLFLVDLTWGGAPGAPPYKKASKGPFWGQINQWPK